LRIKDALRLLNEKFEREEAWYILEDILKKKKHEICLINNSFSLNEKAQKALFGIIQEKERAPDKPLAYILKKVNFMGLDFKIEEGVFIPRQETEILVEEALNIYKAYYEDKFIRLLDVGCGSGVVGLSLGKFIEKSMVYLTDISLESIKCAIFNAKRLNILNKTRFIVSDILSGINQKVDIIVANLPYVKSAEFNHLSSKIKNYEPINAILAGEKGTEKIEKLLRSINSSIKFILFEIGYTQSNLIKNLLNSMNLRFYLIKDLQGIDRVCVVHH
jgi:release factor glutamine methyltransferase